MVLMLVTQLGLPVLLLLWLAIFPAKQRWAYLLQAICIALLLADIALVGLWMILPWWIPYGYALVFILILTLNLVKRKSDVKLEPKMSWVGSLALLVLISLTGIGTYLGGKAIAGRALNDQNVANIASPLTTGTYLVAQGGSNQTVNGHYMTLDESVPRFAAWRGQSKAIDIIRIDGFGLRADGLMPEDPSRYKSFGTPLVAPCDGRVVAAVDGIQDMQIPQMDRANMLGNHVIIDCGNFFIAMAHFKNGSLKVTSTTPIKTGDPLGELGNSGNSAEPHLHIHAQRNLPTEIPISGEPIALTIDGKFLVRNDRIFTQ